MATFPQQLPSTGPAREALRQKGQFWTPDWIADAMVCYVIAGGHTTLFDPAVGAGVFFRAAKRLGNKAGRTIDLQGTELDPDALEEARQTGLTELDLANVAITDFVLHPPNGVYEAIVANPPYIRHHRLTSQVKEQLKALALSMIGKVLDGRSGYHIYFLLRALQRLEKGGRLAFIMPADTCEGVFAATLWKWIARSFCLDAVVTFAPHASPFPNVDTNAMIFFIRNAEPRSEFLWVKCNRRDSDALKTWVLSGFTVNDSPDLEIHVRDLSEGTTTGLSRAPLEENGDPTLGDFATVLRGIATGANEFFFLTRKQAEDLGIPEGFLIRAIGRTRDVFGELLSIQDIEALDAKGRPTRLFSPDGRSLHDFPSAVQEYLKQGEALRLMERPLISTRKPWYKMEVRSAPPFLFAYLGRRNARFIRNYAGVVPLTCLLCVYPRNNDPIFIDRLWEVLRNPETVNNLIHVGKSYGDGAIKVEPRSLEKLRLPKGLIDATGLELHPTTRQFGLSLG
jgi:hypothetical protein